MAEYLSGSINFQGLGSGTDFTSIIAQLKKIESIPMNRMTAWKADWQARAEAFETVLQSMRDAKSALSAMNSREKFITKLASSSKPEIASLSATGKALDGAHSIEVTQLASNAIWSCGTEFEKKTSSISTAATEFTYTYKGQTRTLKIAGNTGLESFVNMINNDPQNKGIRANIVQSGASYRLQIQGRDSGKDATLNITPSPGLNFISNPAWQSSQSYSDPVNDKIWGNGVGAGEFRYATSFGAEKTIAIDNNTTVQQLIDRINDPATGSGPGTASLDSGGRLVITGATTVKGPATAGSIDTSYWTSSKYYGANEALSSKINVWKSDAANKVMNLSDAIHSGAGNFTIDVNGKKASVRVEANTSLQDLVDRINNAGLGKIASAEAINGDAANGYVLRLDSVTGFTGSGGASLAGASALDGDAKGFKFTIGSESFTADIFPGLTTPQDAVNAINEAYRAGGHAGAADVASLVKNADGKYAIQIAGATAVTGAGINGAVAKAANGITSVPGSWTGLTSFANASDTAIPAMNWQSGAVTSVRSPSHSLGNTAGDFAYTIGGTTQSVAVAANASLQDIANAINLQTGGGIASVKAVDPRDLSQGYTLNIEGASAGGGTNGLSLAGGASPTTPPRFMFSLDGHDYDVPLAVGASAQGVVDAINGAIAAATGSPSTAAKLVEEPPGSGRSVITIDGASVSQSAGLEGANSITSTSVTGSGGSGLPGGFMFDGWVTQAPQNAIFKLDNWPDALESTSNTVTGVLDGATISLFDLGKAQLSVTTDTESVKENIQNFLDAVNSVLTTIRELTKVEESTYKFSVTKKTEDEEDNSYDEQQGSLLTGNYGVQLLNSRMKSLAAGMPPGFQKIQGSDLLSGDLLSALSQIGIKTVSDQDDPNYGLLVIAPTSTAKGMQDMDQTAFDQALATKLDSLLNFFACDDEGSSSSAEFRYASHVKGGTKAGTYDVRYDVSYDPAAPNVPILDVYIDGRKAARDGNMDGYWFTSASGPSAGLAIQIDDLNAGSHSGKISIKQGKIREMEDFFTAETRGYDEINHTGGALEVLKRNYANIMKNIDTKIAREQERLTRWERTQKLAFSRLDTLLAQYNANQQRLEGEIAKLG